MGSARVELMATVQHLQKWLAPHGGAIGDAAAAAAAAYATLLEPKRFKADAGGERVGFIAARDVQQGEVLLQLPEKVAVTSIDAEQHPLIGGVAGECSELIALALWVMAERAAGAASPWAPLLQTLPDSTNSPILWDDRERAEWLAGSPVLEEARSRQAQLKQQWAQLADRHFAADADRFPATVFNEAAFLRAFCVVLASATFLPSAGGAGSCAPAAAASMAGCQTPASSHRNAEPAQPCPDRARPHMRA
jgi:hypothetical protein